MLNLKGLIKSVITSNLGSLVEDFTENDISIDRWNGRILKENVKIKRDAFEWLTKACFGAPCTVVQGFIKKLQIDVPWSELQSKPLEVTVEDLHVILTSSEAYERAFVKGALLELKKKRVAELQKLIEQQLKGAAERAVEESAGGQDSGFLSHLKKVVMENLRINVRNVHIRFEDNFVSRRDQAFNFGIIAESITYSMTNNRFVRAFLNIEDKLQEQRSFSMLKVLKLAAYWNSNAQDNWSKSREFIHLAAKGTIAFSKNHTEILMSKHNAQKQDLGQSSVFLVQPTDLSVKFRSNLSPQAQPHIPVSTTALEVSDVALSLDEETLKDVQYLSKFFAWHSMSIKKQSYRKLRPAYNIPVKGNARAYWRYAIKATIYTLRKQRQDPARLAKKRQLEMVELSELFRLEQINEHLRQAGAKERHLEVGDRVQVARFRSFRSEAMLAKRRKHLEYKLTAEQIVVAKNKADKQCKDFIEAYQQRTGWRSWVPSMLKTSYWYGGGGAGEGAPAEGHPSEATQQEGPVSASHFGGSDEDAQLYAHLQEIVQKAEQLDSNRPGQARDEGEEDEDEASSARDKPIQSHLSVTVPLFELLVVSKQHGAYNAKCFMSVALQDIFLQKISYLDGNQQQLFSLRAFDVIDKLVQASKFQRVLSKGPIRQVPAHQPTSNLSQRVVQRFSQQSVGGLGAALGRRNWAEQASSLHEVEEESNPNINNGLPRVRFFQDITRNVRESEHYFFLFQLTATQVQRRAHPDSAEPAQRVLKYKVDTLLNHIVLFYNRTLISRAQTFVHQATVRNSQNAAAEADFDTKLAAVQKQTEKQVTDLLEQSEFEVACALKGIEVLVPDDINFQDSKFILLQTGNVMARSRQPIADRQASRSQTNGLDLGPSQTAQEQLVTDQLFTDSLQQFIHEHESANQASQSFDQDDYLPQEKASSKLQGQQLDVMRVLHGGKNGGSSIASEREDYALTVFDIQVLYLPSCSLLEAIEYNELSKEETEKRHSLLKRTDVQLDFSKVQVHTEAKAQESCTSSLIRVGLQVANVDCKLTTKEVREIKFFADKFIQYHTDLDEQVKEELVKIRLEAQFRQSISTRNQNQRAESLNLQAQQAKLRELQGSAAIFDAVKKSLGGAGSASGESLQRQNSLQSQKSIQSFKSLPASDYGGSSDDEFFDALDTFDQEIIDLLEQNTKQRHHAGGQAAQDGHAHPATSLLEAVAEEESDEAPQLQSQAKSQHQVSSAPKFAICVSIQIGKLRFQVLEAADIKEELVRNLKERLQGHYNSNEPIELQVQQKGLPFLNFEVSKACATLAAIPPPASRTGQLQTETSDVYLASVSVRDFCLMNQEKVSQPQVLLRSSNFEVTQPHFTGAKERLESFDRSSEVVVPREAKKAHYFDLEDEDDMAMADQAIDEIDDFFLRCVCSGTVNRQTVQGGEPAIDTTSLPREESKDPIVNIATGPRTAPSTEELTQVDSQTQIGLVEGEVTEHSVRKILECLVADFPFSPSSGADTSAAFKASSPNDDLVDKTFIEEVAQQDCQELQRKRRRLKFDVKFDGLNYKMRLRKEESVVKVIELGAVFSDLTDSSGSGGQSKQQAQLSVTDFQVLHQNNELVFKHSFGQDLVLAEDDKSLLMPGSLQILNLSLTKEGSQATIEASVNNFLCIFESRACLQILQNVHTLQNLVLKSGGGPRLQQTLLRASSQANLSAQEAISQTKISLSLALNDCHLQVPVTESKNQLFVELNQIRLGFEKGPEQNQLVSADLRAIDIYVAKQINQSSKYFLIQLHDSTLEAQLAPKGSLRQASVDIGLVRLTMNENYLLFLASLIEHHFNDVQALIAFTKQLAPVSVDPDVTLALSEQQQSETDQLITESEQTKLGEDSPFIRSILAAEKHVSGSEGACLMQAIKLSVGSVQLEWVFGLGFDDHEENFVTLNNRGFSKLILDQFDMRSQQKTKLLETAAFEVVSDAKEPPSQLLIDTTCEPKSIRKSQSKQNQLGLDPLQAHVRQMQPTSKEDHQSLKEGSSNYEKLTLRLEDIQFEQAKTLAKKVYSNLSCKQALLEQNSPQLKRAYPIFLVRPRSIPRAVSLTSTSKTLKAMVSSCELRVCQRSVEVISNLIKDVYSCKNVIKRGKKRRFFRAFFKQSKKEPQPQMPSPPQSSSYTVSLDLRKARIVCYDSAQNEARAANESGGAKAESRTPAAGFVQNLQAQAIEDFGEDPDAEFFKPTTLLTLETGLRFSNLKPVKESDLQARPDGDGTDSNCDSQEDGYQPDRQLNAKLSSLSVYTNTKRVSLEEGVEPEQRLMILYPTDVVVGQQFYSQKNLQMVDISVSLVEFETSFKQVFALQLLFDKLRDACKPVTQIFAHIDQQKNTKSRSAAAAPESQGEAAHPKTGILLMMTVHAVYFALIKESLYSDSGATAGPYYGSPGESSCVPMLSLEVKWFELCQKTQVSGSKQTDVTFPLEIYYFNQQLNFFEPVIERVLLRLQSVEDPQGNTQREVRVEDVLNVNFSVALYENVFVLLENLNQEQEAFKKEKEQAERETLLASLRSLNGGDKQASAALQSAAAQRDYAGGAGGMREASSVNSHSLSFIKNKTGELLLFKAGRQPAFTEMQANETLPLDFQKGAGPAVNVVSGTNLLSTDDAGSKGLFDGVALSEMQPDSDIPTNNWADSSSEEESEADIDELSSFAPEARGLGGLRRRLDGDGGQKPRSMYRRGKFKFKKSEPNRVILQVLIQHGKDLERTPSFEINFDSLSCQRVFLDEQRQLYVICQLQNKEGQKVLIVRSPMQVTNNLQIPMEVQLNSLAAQPRPAARRNNNNSNLGEVADQEESKEARRNNILRGQGNFDFSMVVKPEQSMIIPLQACHFTSVQVRPLVPLASSKSASSMYQPESQFEWSQVARVSLLQDEKLIFEQKPQILSAKMARRDSALVDRNNNQVFFALNANTYSIRSYLDFNTQQTDFISLRYLSLTAPFTFQNLIPVPITMLFKNVERKGEALEGPQGRSPAEDAQLYDLDLKHNSSLQVLYLNPLGNFDFSLAIPGYDKSSFVKLKLEQEEDFELSTDLCQSNYLESVGLGFNNQNPSAATGGGTTPRLRSTSGKAENSNAAESKEQADTEQSQILKTAQFRFVKQKRLLLQLCSQFQSQFNICANIAFVQGFYHISFFAKYWLLNNTQMPLQARVAQQTFSFPTLDLPFQSVDFDFETAKQFLDSDYGQTNTTHLKSKEGKEGQLQTQAPKRRDSAETFKTETVTMREGNHDEDGEQRSMSSRVMPGGGLINHKRLKSQIRAIDANGEPLTRPGMLRVKPWEAYRYSESKSKGLLAVLSQEDIDRVSSIYFTQEMLKEEEKGEETEYATAKEPTATRSDVFVTANTQTANDSSDQFLTARNPSDTATNLLGTTGNRIKSDQQPEKKVQFIIEGEASQTQSNSRGSGVYQRHAQALTRSVDPNMLRVERLTKLSKTSIQMTNFQQQLNEQQAVPLNHTALSEFELYEAPLDDKDQLKRVILFSDVPVDESPTTNTASAPAVGSAPDLTVESLSEAQQLLLRICDSEWSSLPFEVSKLQSEPIRIKDAQRKEGQPQSLFELVAVVSFLPPPFSFSKLICFQPRYLMVNRTFHTLYVVQSECEELGSFKIFPQETSVFHWTDASKQLQVCVSLDEHEYSGNLRIDGIGEFTLRLKSTQEKDSTILNVSISEENNSFYIVFTDISYAPPYRLENLTKTRFKVAQVQSRPDDFDHLHPFQPLSFAWSYPLQPKLLRVSLSQLDAQEDLGTFSIDSISKTERIIMRDRYRRREFVLEIASEKTMKVVRIMHPTQTKYEDAVDPSALREHEQARLESTLSKIKLRVNRLGLSVVNSQAREIFYTSLFGLRFSVESTAKHQKVALKAAEVQVDNQLSRQPDAIILKREQSVLGKRDFLALKFHFVRNQAIENLRHYKYILVSLVPFELNLDGNFCDETYKYLLDVFRLTAKFTSRSKLASEAHQALLGGGDLGSDPTKLKAAWQTGGVGADVAQIKSAFNELKRKGQPVGEAQRDVQKVYVEHFQIDEVRMSFTFSSSPILFREFTMNPTLKFFLVLLSNLKNVKLRFGKYQVQNQHLLQSIFVAQLKRFYVQECVNHKQLFKIVSSMGLFGSLSTTITGLSTAFKSLVQRPFSTHQTHENPLKAVLLGSLVFLKDSVYVVSGSLGSILETFKSGFGVLLTYGHPGQSAADLVVDRDLFEDDIEQAQRGITSFTTPLTTIDTQNRIWLKILVRERRNFDDKKRIIMRKQQHKMRDFDAHAHPPGQAPETSLHESLVSGQATGQYMIDSKLAQQDPSALYKMAYFAGQVAFFLPRKIALTGTAMLKALVPEEIGRSRSYAVAKVRPPRFVSFTMELEPYSKKKAFALEILNDINLSVFETETIQKLYTMNAHVVIITGKRIICVDELRHGYQAPASLQAPAAREKGQAAHGTGKILSKLISGGARRNYSEADLLNREVAAGGEQPEQAQQQTQQQERAGLEQDKGADDDEVASSSVAAAAARDSGLLGGGQAETGVSGGPQFKHWNIFFRDIYRVSIDIVDRETNKVISQSDLERLMGASGAERGLDGSDKQLKINFVLKIHYQVKEQEEGGYVDAMGDKGAGSKGRRNKDKTGGGEGMLGGGVFGLHVGRKEIVTKDWKVMRRVYTAIQNYSRRSTLF